ncbi:cupin domain-containing protein [Halovivax limisalsi]|uniref:cupin domain-containing protein n=1 Tax=Halovivax limisalsi TaxID=1453760 RepID=UPI001FFCE590|nr:cupin domain-containing protein [Halovivax limisalsi]
MKHVRIDDVENDVQPAAVVRRLTEALETTDVAINHYELEPGDSFAFGYHRHEIQEEVFFVRSGTATFETETGDVTVGAGEIVRFAPGEFQRGWNRGDERVVALALGAPLAYGESELRRDCPTCGGQTRNELDRQDDEDAPEGAAVVAYCLECDTETGRWVTGSMPGDVP